MPPRLWVQVELGHPSLNRIVSGLFRVNEALKTPNASCGDLQGLHRSEDISTNSLTSFPQGSNLRKSSSAADWNTAANISRTSQDMAVVGSSASPTQPPPLNPLPIRPRSEHHEESLLRGIFHRGFLSKPGIHSDEENHRYLMTLDR
ncbi:hypothetical protein OESDEN_01185 [Oesophagostomum dentatum]|uniref:Uncharacterized protein n=1 Tax=Oesophagostomum dentatum TaxID=61180 RepID=A0A0B1TNI8_OESDE|nr:hypothetical protein OESDEN_01185 [Oesophagostomum dentatum]